MHISDPSHIFLVHMIHENPRAHLHSCSVSGTLEIKLFWGLCLSQSWVWTHRLEVSSQMSVCRLSFLVFSWSWSVWNTEALHWRLLLLRGSHYTPLSVPAACFSMKCYLCLRKILKHHQNISLRCHILNRFLDQGGEDQNHKYQSSLQLIEKLLKCVYQVFVQ